MSNSKSSFVYRSIREGERVRRTYLGPCSDPVVQTLLESERLEKATREAEQRKTEHELSIMETMDGCLQLIHSSANRACAIFVNDGNEPTDPRSGDSLCPTSDFRLMLMKPWWRMPPMETGKLSPNFENCSRRIHNLEKHYLIEPAAGGAIDVKESLRQTLAEKREESARRGQFASRTDAGRPDS